MNVFSSLCDGVETISDEIGMLCFFPFLKTSKIKRKLMVPLSNLSPLELYPFDWFYRLIDVIEAIGELTLIRYHSIGYVFFFWISMVISPNWCGNFSSPCDTCVKNIHPRFFQHGNFQNDQRRRFGAGDTKINNTNPPFWYPFAQFFLRGKSETKTWLEWSDLWFTTPVWWPVFSPRHFSGSLTVAGRAGGSCVFSVVAIAS